jgi:phage terminase large subunit
MQTPTTTIRPTASSPAERYAHAARLAGMPRDQLERFIAGGYAAQRHQLALHAAARRADRPDGPSLIGFGGRRGPGKTHATFAQIALDDCQRCPGLKILFLRKVLKAGKESFEDVRRKVLFATPHEYKVQAGVVVFPNSSRIVLGHFRHEDDIDNYLGIEYDGAAFEEATQLSKKKVEMLRGSIRSTRSDWRPRIYMTTNPGGIGHQWFRSAFVLPWRAGQERETCFIPASADENRYLDDGYRRWPVGGVGEDVARR